MLQLAIGTFGLLITVDTSEEMPTKMKKKKNQVFLSLRIYVFCFSQKV
jgi:hypothetical protein